MTGRGGGERYGDERFLPISSVVILPTSAASPERLFIHAAAGVIVHVVEGGVATLVDRSQAGEVEISVDGDRSYRYSRLLPSSIRCEVDQDLTAGEVLGVVGSAPAGADESTGLLLALYGGGGDPLDLHASLVGLADPSELAAADDAADTQTGDPLRSEPSHQVPSQTAPDRDDDALSAMVSSRVRPRR